MVMCRRMFVGIYVECATGPGTVVAAGIADRSWVCGRRMMMQCRGLSLGGRSVGESMVKHCP